MENKNALANQSSEVKLRTKTSNEVTLKNKLQNKKQKKLEDINNNEATEP